MLGLAYSASIGGLATIIGTPPNGVLLTQFSQLFPDAPDITFAGWMIFALPLSVVFMLSSWFLLTRFIFPLPATTPFSGREFLDREIKGLGSMGNEEKKVATIFFLFALLMMTRKERLFGADIDIYGWSYYLDNFLVTYGNIHLSGSISMTELYLS